MQPFSHETVLLYETVDALNVRPDGIYLDGTAGGGGHSELIAKRLTTGRLYATDIDPDAVAAATARLAGLPATVLHGSYADLDRLLDGQGVDRLDGMVLDLGVSSHQLDEGERGFSYKQDAPLDMRMGGNGPTAADILAGYSKQELIRVLRDYGDEAFAPAIASAIVAQRERQPLQSTLQLAELVASCYPAAKRRGGNPARKTFQALRIEVNGETDNIKNGITAGFARLKPGGRLAVITFHSLEDRIVKTLFKDYLTGCICDKSAPVCVCGRTPRARLITRKPVLPSAQETEHNRRSRSARLRVIEKIKDSPYCGQEG